jgi:hypothetical protein
MHSVVNPLMRVPGELLVRGSTPSDSMFCYDAELRDLVILFVHVIATLARLSELQRREQENAGVRRYVLP